MKLAIGSDKSGFSAKEAIKAYLTEQGVDFEDLGTVDPEQPKFHTRLPLKVDKVCF